MATIGTEVKHWIHPQPRYEPVLRLPRVRLEEKIFRTATTRPTQDDLKFEAHAVAARTALPTFCSRCACFSAA